MRICLYWNPTAGNRVPLDDIKTAITDAGHEVAQVLEDEEDPATAFQMGVEAVAAAGGDGTVARVARALAGSNLPVVILPLGTANNIATSLGITGDPLATVGEWASQKVVRIDVGVVTDEHGERLFGEGVGTGLLPKGIKKGQNDPTLRAAEDASDELTKARGVFLDAVADLRSQRTGMCIDGETAEGDYLFVEILNIASVGPRLRLSAETAPADGLLSVVIAGEDDRQAIESHLRRPWNDVDDHAWLKSWRARRVEVSGWHEYHVDDEVRSSESGRLEIAIRPAALAVFA